MSQVSRKIQDAQLTVFTNHPAQNTNANSASIDLVLAGNVSRESLEVMVSADAAPNLANSQTCIIELQDSADNVTFVKVASIDDITIQTGGGGVGAAAASIRIALPSTIRQYIRINDAMSSTAGDNTAVGITFQLLF